jgi:outer membrane protein TolC
VQQNQELAATGAGNKFDLEQAEANLRDLEAQLGTAIANEAQVRAQLAAIVDGDIASVAKIKADLRTPMGAQQTTVSHPAIATINWRCGLERSWRACRSIRS